MKPNWPVYLVEGVFKAGALHSLGVPAMALMGSETKRHQEQLRLLPYKFVAIGDNDDAGRKFARNLGGVVSPVDLDEMSREDLSNFVSNLERKYANY
jgi:DNA primase